MWLTKIFRKSISWALWTPAQMFSFEEVEKMRGSGLPCLDRSTLETMKFA